MPRELEVFTDFQSPDRQYCCDEMTHWVTQTCSQHIDPWDCPDMVIVYSPHWNEFGLPIHDGGASKVTIFYCPFCGVRLPESKRDLWFENLETLGISPLEDDIPEKFRSDAWWRVSGS
jgi:hypothetical protein